MNKIQNFVYKAKSAMRGYGKALAAYVPDCLLVTGIASISYGSWLIYEPAGFIVGGVLLLVGGVKASSA